MSKKNKVDWKNLSEQLQEALSDEIKESQEKDQVIADLMLIVHYLETKLGIYKYED
jgi:hypothetical protein